MMDGTEILRTMPAPLQIHLLILWSLFPPKD